MSHSKSQICGMKTKAKLTREIEINVNLVRIYQEI